MPDDRYYERVQYRPPTVYANVVNIRTTPAELILDFGCIFPENQAATGSPAEGIGQPQPFDPEVRVILSVAAIQKLGEVLIQAAQQHLKASQQINAAGS